MSRPLAERLAWELNQIREELREAMTSVPDDLFDWSPADGMKSYRAILQEVGAMMAETTILLTEGRVPEWTEAESAVTGNTVSEVMVSLDQLLKRLLGYIAACRDLNEAIPISRDWEWFFGVTELEREELVRWVARHEYYHLGQVITYNWARGVNPYGRE